MAKVQQALPQRIRVVFTAELPKFEVLKPCCVPEIKQLGHRQDEGRDLMEARDRRGAIICSSWWAPGLESGPAIFTLKISTKSLQEAKSNT